MADLIQFRRDTKANWATANPVLALGEPGLETDTRKVKYGDGTTAWNNLPYGGGAGDGAYNISEANNGATYADLSAALAAVPTSEHKGGMSIKFILRTNTGTEEEPVYKDDYVQYRLIATAWSTSEADWQGVDNEPTAGSDNLVKSGGVYDAIAAKSEMPLVDENGFHVIDEDLNVGMKYDKAGLDAAKVSSHFIEVLKAAGVSVNSVMASHAAEISEDGFFIADESLNVGVKVDNEGIHAKNIFEYEIIED